MTVSSDRVVNEARRWLGTPYRHQASCRGAGCDCLGLVRGIYRAIHGSEPEAPPAYRPDWAEQSNEETLQDAAHRHLTPGKLPSLQNVPLPLGAVLLFRWQASCPCKHLGIVSGLDHFIHAYEPAGTVESPLVPIWRNKVTALFFF
ncbi:peptidase P60 [Polycladidibacter hongkongensis]|uniref:peptidase P60 n=1 Tax=Polycladidibacter hongkongensis TaxID=1647556 RepID=UPI00083439D1|nr:peptidase P60 [Pseudovibrio hongkongensis]